MKLHLHIGPGHHDKILRNQLEKHNVDFSYTEHHPVFHFSVSEKKENKKLYTSKLYELVNWLVWGVSNRIGFLRKQNRHYMITYPLYDKIAGNHLTKDCELLFCWPQVSLNIIRKVKNNKKIVVLDYPIPHINTWQKLLNEEATLHNIESPHSLFSNSMMVRMNKEIELADYISVPSEFVKNSFIENNIPESKLIFNSYGIDTKLFTSTETKKVDGKLKVIFVGSIEFRKGVQYLLKAFKDLPIDQFELRLIGTVHEGFKKISRKYLESENVHWLGQLPKEQTAKELRFADVMVMPSILEGLSLTILESMASGTPVISTVNAGGLGVIENGKDGWIVPIRKTAEIVSTLKWCSCNRLKVVEMGKSAKDKVLKNYDIANYGDRFMDKVNSLLNEK